jgi:dsRNA-specific ribonuclease
MLVDSSDDEEHIINNEAIINNEIIQKPLSESRSELDLHSLNNEVVFNPYNNLNHEITTAEITTFLNRFKIYVSPFNTKIYQRAFVHRSYTRRPNLENQASKITLAEQPDNCLPLKTKSNERLEFLGDGILEAITKYYLYKRFPKADEGFMTEKKIALVKNEHIGKLAYDIGLHKWYILSRHAEEKKTRTNLKKLGCLFEAFIGAIFLDFNKIDITDDKGWFENVFVTGPGFQMCQIFIERVFEEYVDWDRLINNDDNFKNRLQVIIQKEFKTTPDYVELEVNEDGYTMGIYICLGEKIYNMNINNALQFGRLTDFQEVHRILETEGKAVVFLSKSSHKIKKKAEQHACELAIALINQDSTRPPTP